MNTNTQGNIINEKFEDNRRILLEDMTEGREYSFILDKNALDYDRKMRKLAVYQEKPRMRHNVNFENGTPAQKTVILKLQNRFKVDTKNIVIKPSSKMNK